MLLLAKGHVRGSRVTTLGEGDVDPAPMTAEVEERPLATTAREPRSKSPIKATETASAWRPGWFEERRTFGRMPGALDGGIRVTCDLRGNFLVTIYWLSYANRRWLLDSGMGLRS